MSLSNNFPTIRPTLLLDFANSNRLDPRVTFTRASTATYYDGVTTAKAEQNLLLQSQDFTTTWGNTRSTDVANTDTAPDGTVTADSVLQQSGETTAGNVSQSTSVQASDYVISVFAKPNGKNFLRIVENLQTGSTVVTFFDVQNGTIGTTGSGHTATITASTNGYYRCSVKFTANAARSGSVFFGLADSDNSVVVVDSGGLYLWGAQLEQRSSVTAYTATTTAPITNYIPVLLTAQSNVPRFDHNPTTGAALGLLIEEQRTNLLTYSEDFANAAWTKSGATVTADSTIAPNGTTTADTLVENTSTGQHRVFRGTSGTTNTNPYTVSFFAKAGTRSRVYVGLFETPTFARGGNAVFDLLAGTVVNATSGSGGATGGSATIQNVGNGWYRCAYTVTLGGTDTAIFNDINIVSTGTTISYTGDGTGSIFLWGAQLEAGAFATSYIPTTTTALTRNADVASITGTNFSSWYNASEGTIYASALPRSTAATLPRFYEFNGASTAISIRTVGIGGSIAFEVQDTTTQASFATGPWSSTAFMRVAGAYKVNDFAGSQDGGAVVTDNSGVIPTVTAFYIGNRSDGARNLNGWIARLTYYPKRLPDATLVALTA